MKDIVFNFMEVTPQEIDLKIAERVRVIRKRRKMSQERLSDKSGVSLGSVKRFERSGEISLMSLTKIAIALEIEQDMKSLFADIPYRSLEEIDDENR